MFKRVFINDFIFKNIYYSNIINNYILLLLIKQPKLYIMLGFLMNINNV